MSVYTLHLNEIINFIGGIGESIFSEFLVHNKYFIIAKEFSIPNYKKSNSWIRVDYVTSCNLKEMVELETKIKQDDKSVLIEKINNYTKMNGANSYLATIKNIYHNYSFWTKCFLSFILIIETFFLRTSFNIISFSVIEKLWKYTASSLIVLFIAGLLPFARYLFKLNYKLNNKQSLDITSQRLCHEMEVPLTDYILIPDENNASVYNDELYLGSKILNNLTLYEINAIIAHEISHQTNEKKHMIVFFLGSLILMVIGYFYVIGLSKVIRFPVLFALSYLLWHQFAWYRELDCDENAIKYVPIKNLQNALRKIAGEKINAYSFLHPSMRFRINNLERWKKT